MLFQLFGTDSQKTSVSLPILLSNLLISSFPPCTLLCCIPLTTEARTLQAILRGFYSCTTTPNYCQVFPPGYCNTFPPKTPKDVFPPKMSFPKDRSVPHRCGELWGMPG